MPERRFRQTFDKAMQERTQVGGADQQWKLGHPEYERLGILEKAKSNIVVLFLDIRGFTKLSLARENEELLGILQAMTLATIQLVTDNGGYVGEFTGDGVMAYFGDRHTSDEAAAFAALRTASELMVDVKDYVNPKLTGNGSGPIRIGIGVEFGPVLWSRIGIPSASQVKAISDVTFVAGKLATSRFTGAWECKMGERLARWLEDDFKSPAKPYTFQLEGRQFTHELYAFDWQKFYEADIRQPELQMRLAGRKIGAPVAILGASFAIPAQRENPGPRLLKDQPFF